MKSKTFRASAMIMAALLTAGAVCVPLPESSGISVTVDAATEKLSAPTYIALYEKTTKSLTLLWDKVEGASAYRVYVYDTKKEKYVPYKIVKDTTCTVSGLSSGRTYKFRIAALKKEGGKYKAGKASSVFKARTAYRYKPGDTVSCDLYSLTLPEGTKYEIETDGSTIAVYDKACRDEGWGGFAFMVAAYEKQSDYYGIMDKKVGELKGNDGKLYDIVVSYPSEVQYDYQKYPVSAPISFDKLYFGSSEIIKTIKASDGTFTLGAGMSGSELYGDVLEKHYKALTEKWDSSKLEEEDMSVMYNVMAVSSEDGILDKVGYAYYDINGDGIDELLIGECSSGNTESVIYDIYTIKDRKPIHVLSGWDRNRYYLLSSGMLCNEYSGSAMLSGWKISCLMHNDTELTPQIELKYDAETDPDDPYFISYGTSPAEPVSEKELLERKADFEGYLHIDYTPFSSF